jgi:uncharacterized protein YukE
MAPRHSSDAGSDSGSSVPLGDSSESSGIVEQARGRSDGFEMGGDRAIVNPPNWNSKESQELYDGAIHNNYPGTAQAIGQMWTGHGQELSQASNDLYNAIAELGSAWIGQGAASAQGALVGIANSSSQASEAAHTMASRMAQQAAAAEEVKKMPAPKNYDPASAMTAALAGGPAAMIADQKVQADAAADVKAQQVAFFNAYTKSMSDVDRSTPSFGPESLGLKPMAGNGGPSRFNRVGGIGHTGGMSGVGQGGPGSVFNTTGPVFGDQGSSSGAHGSGSFAGAGLGPDSGHFSQAGVAPAAAGTTGAGGVGGPTGVGSGAFSAGSAPAPVAPAITSAPSSGTHVGQALGLGAALGGGLGLAGSRVLGKGNRSGGKADDSTAAAANDGSAGQSAASASAPQQGLVSASGTIGGTPTPPPMGGMGGAGGAQRQEDEEHTHASFLIEADPDEAFGANQATPPPVIGAWSEDE